MGEIDSFRSDTSYRYAELFSIRFKFRGKPEFEVVSSRLKAIVPCWIRKESWNILFGDACCQVMPQFFAALLTVG
jgi:hypothetical protein